MEPEGGRLFANLGAIRLAPADIDAVIISHTHSAHVGTLFAAMGGSEAASGLKSSR
jgi:metal-dependent hydrolase (beta-lactamase superfamily II)